MKINYYVRVNHSIKFHFVKLYYLCICWHSPVHKYSFDDMDSRKRILLRCTCIFYQLETYGIDKSIVS